VIEFLGHGVYFGRYMDAVCALNHYSDFWFGVSYGHQFEVGVSLLFNIRFFVSR
jgi:hypothetical protein